MTKAGASPFDPKRNQRALGLALVLLGGLIATILLLNIATQTLAGNWQEMLIGFLQMLLGLVIYAGIPIAIGFWLIRRAGKLPRLSSETQHPILGAKRLAFATLGILAMVLAGGCGLLFMSSHLSDLSQAGANGGSIGPGVILMLAGPPFLAGLIIWWLAARVGRR